MECLRLLEIDKFGKAEDRISLRLSRALCVLFTNGTKYAFYENSNCVLEERKRRKQDRNKYKIKRSFREDLSYLAIQ